MASVCKRPPLGVMNRKLHDNARANEILNACLRYTAVDKKVPNEWISELQDLIT